MKQNTIKPHKSQTKKRKRVGRGNGSGSGTFAGRGMNGQNSRSGGKRRPGFEGGQTPLIRKMPKLPGFTHPHAKKKEAQVINLSVIEANFKDGEQVTPESLKEKGLISSLKRPVKVLAKGEVSKKVTVENVKISEAAQKAITKAGGTVKVEPKAEKTKEKVEQQEEKSE